MTNILSAPYCVINPGGKYVCTCDGPKGSRLQLAPRCSIEASGLDGLLRAMFPLSKQTGHTGRGHPGRAVQLHSSTASVNGDIHVFRVNRNPTKSLTPIAVSSTCSQV